MIGGDDDLFCSQPKLVGDRFDRVDRRAVHIGLADVTKP